MNIIQWWGTTTWAGMGHLCRHWCDGHASRARPWERLGGIELIRDQTLPQKCTGWTSACREKAAEWCMCISAQYSSALTEWQRKNVNARPASCKQRATWKAKRGVALFNQFSRVWWNKGSDLYLLLLFSHLSFMPKNRSSWWGTGKCSALLWHALVCNQRGLRGYNH